MFRLKVSHLQVLTTFLLPDALPTVDKNNIEQSTEQCQHPGEGAHIHKV